MERERRRDARSELREQRDGDEVGAQAVERRRAPSAAVPAVSPTVQRRAVDAQSFADAVNVGIHPRAVQRQVGAGDAGTARPEVRLPLQVVVLHPVAPRVEADLARARTFFERYQITVVIANRNEIPEPRAHQLVDRQERVERETVGGARPTEFDAVDPGGRNLASGRETPPTATPEALELMAVRGVPGLATVYWLPVPIRNPSGRTTGGFTFDSADLGNVTRDREGIVIAPGAPDDVLPHELLHLLLHTGHVEDPDNALADGMVRTGDSLTPAQIEALRRSQYLEGMGAGRRLDAPTQRAADHAIAADPDALDESTVAEIAGRGVAQAGTGLPHGEQIAASFGRHDVSGIRAAVSGGAAEASTALGARAYATGDAIAFAAAPDLHLAAHEAAHVIQQRSGVQLAGGLGREGDAYERHADDVAGAVVRGESAEALLDAVPGGRGGERATQRVVQRVIEDRIGEFEFENGHWHRTGGAALSDADRMQLRSALRQRATASPTLPPEVRRAYVGQLDRGDAEPLPESVWFRDHGRALVRTDEDYRRTMAAIAAAHGNGDDLSNAPPGEPIPGRGPRPRPGLEALSLTGGSPTSTRVERPGAPDAALVRMDDAVGTDGDQTLHSGGFHECTGFSTSVTGPDGSRREVAHVAASDGDGAYSQLVDSLAHNLPRGGGAMDVYVTTTAATRTAPDHPDAAPMPPDHTSLMRSLRGDLGERLGSSYRVRQDGNSLVVTSADGATTTTIHVGVDERPSGAGPSRITSAPTGLRTQVGEQPSDLLEHETASRIGHDEPAQRAERIRWILEQRIASARDSGQATLARLALHDLDSAPPSAEHVDAVAHTAGITDAEIRDARPPDGQTGGTPETNTPRTAPTGTDEPSDDPAPRSRPTEREEPTVVEDPTEQAAPRAPRVEAPAEHTAPHPEPELEPELPPMAPPEDSRLRLDVVREELEQRAASSDTQEAARARRGLARLDDAGPAPDFDTIERAAREGGVDPYRVAPRASTVAPEVHGDSVGATQTGEDGSTRGLRAGVGQHGASVTATVNPNGATGNDRSIGVVYQEQRDAHGEVVGRDAGLTGGRGPISGELTGGYTFRVDPAAERPDGSFAVSWQVQLRGGGGMSGTGTVGGGGGGLRGSTTRTGTQVFADGDREHNHAAAEAYRESFRDHAMDEFGRAVTAELNTVEWWRGEHAGTTRRVAIGGTLTASGSVAVLQTLRLGGSADFSPAGDATVTRTASGVDVTQAWEIAGGASLSGGNLVSASLGAEGRYRVSETYAVDLDTGEAAFAGFLAHEHPLEAGAGVVLRSRRDETSSGMRMGVGVAILGDVHGGDGSGEIVETTYGPDGESVAHTATGYDRMEGSAVDGTYVRQRHGIEAPDSDADYRITTDLHSSEGVGSADMLGEELGEGRAGARAESSGNWVITEGITQDEALRFHRNLLERFPASGNGPPLGDPLRSPWSALRSVPTNDDRLAAPEHAEELRSIRQRRGAAITAFVSSNRRLGVTMVRGVSGDTDDTQYLRLFHEGGQEDLTVVGERSADDLAADEDHRRRVPTFLGRDGSRQIERWLEAHAQGPVSPEDVAEARTQITDMNARIAQIGNVDNYTDLPPATRAAIVHRYEGYRDRYAAVIQRGGDTVADDMSQDGQAHHAELRALQTRVEQARLAAEVPRDHVVAERRRWGQMHSELTPEGRLPDDIAARTGAMWSSAETAFRGAEDARAAAEARLADSLGGSDRGELAQREAYRSAQGDLERARAFYETARDEMQRLEGVYDRIDLAQHGELAAQPEAPDAPDAPNAPDAPDAPDAPPPQQHADEPAPDHARTPAPEHRRSGGAHHRSAREPREPTSREAHAPRVRQDAIDNATLDARIPRTLGATGRTGRVEFPSGLVVNLTRLAPMPGDATTAAHDTLWIATMTIVEPAPNADVIVVPSATRSGDGISWHELERRFPNQRGLELSCIVRH